MTIMYGSKVVLVQEKCPIAIPPEVRDTVWRVESIVPLLPMSLTIVELIDEESGERITAEEPWCRNVKEIA